MFDVIMRSSYTPKMNRRSNKFPISDCLLSFDIETTSWTDKISTMFLWCLGAAEYKDIVKCNCNRDIEKITELEFGRTWKELDAALEDINNTAMEEQKRYIILVYNLSYEWSYLQRNVEFLAKYYNSTYPTVIEGHHNILGICAGCLMFIDAKRLFGLGSLKQNAAKYGFEKLDYDYDALRHSKTDLTDEDYIYNGNDVLITLGCWSKLLYSNGYEHLNKTPYTQTSMIKDILKRNESVNTTVEIYDQSHKKNDRYTYDKRKRTLFDEAVTIASGVFESFEDKEKLANVLEAGFYGGFAHCNIFTQNKTLFNVASCDLKSAYPGAMFAMWYPRKLIEATNPNKEFYLEMRYLNNKYKNYKELAKSTREKLNILSVCVLEISDIKVKVFENKAGKVTIPLISRHKLLRDEDALFDNGKLIEAKNIIIACTTIDVLTWQQIYDFKIEKCHKLLRGEDIQQLPQYWVNAVEYCYRAKSILKSVIKLYEENKDWKSKYKELKGIDDIEINHVESMETHEAIYYLNMVLLQRKAELNGLYGIMVMHIIRSQYVYTETKEIIEDEQLIRNPKDGTCYLWGMIVTAIVRLWEVTFSLFLIDNECLPVYWDTDSVKSIIPENVDIIKITNEYNNIVGELSEMCKGIGTYDYEETYNAFKSLGSKRYVICEKDNKTQTYEFKSTIAGLPKKVLDGFLTQELHNATKYLKLNEAIKETMNYFRPNIFIDESATDKLIPLYYNVEEPISMDLVDLNGKHSKEVFWPGARLSGIQFAVMDLSTKDNKQYQLLCHRVQGIRNVDYTPYIVFKTKNGYDIKDGKLNTPDLKIFISQKDVNLYI